MPSIATSIKGPDPRHGFQFTVQLHYCIDEGVRGSARAETVQHHCLYLHRGGGASGGRVYLQDVRVGAALVGLAVLCVFQQHLVHVGAGVLEEAVGAVEDDEGDLAVAQHAQLVRLLHQAELALGEGHLWGRGRRLSCEDVTRNER